MKKTHEIKAIAGALTLACLWLSPGPVAARAGEAIQGVGETRDGCVRTLIKQLTQPSVGEQSPSLLASIRAAFAMAPDVQVALVRQPERTPWQKVTVSTANSLGSRTNEAGTRVHAYDVAEYQVIARLIDPDRNETHIVPVSISQKKRMSHTRGADIEKIHTVCSFGDWTERSTAMINDSPRSCIQGLYARIWQEPALHFDSLEDSSAVVWFSKGLENGEVVWEVAEVRFDEYTVEEPRVEYGASNTQISDEYKEVICEID